MQATEQAYFDGELLADRFDAIRLDEEVGFIEVLDEKRVGSQLDHGALIEGEYELLDGRVWARSARCGGSSQAGRRTARQ
jgi:hypothetical protein